MLKIALICHSPTGLTLISRIIELNQIKKIKAEYTFFIDPLITDDELSIIKNKDKIEVEFIRVFSIEVKIKYAWKIFISKIFSSKVRVNKINNNNIKQKINSFNSFRIKEFFSYDFKNFSANN